MADTVVHTPETVTAQMQADISAANAVTGRTDTTVHDAVTALIAGFGSGGGSSVGTSGIYMAKITPEEDLDAFIIGHNLRTTDILSVSIWAETLGDYIPDTQISLHKVWNKTDIKTQRGGNGFSLGYGWDNTNSYATPKTANVDRYETLTVIDENTIRMPRTQSGTSLVYKTGVTYTVIVIAASAFPGV